MLKFKTDVLPVLGLAGCHSHALIAKNKIEMKQTLNNR